jgi:hypothetical protein
VSVAVEVGEHRRGLSERGERPGEGFPSRYMTALKTRV